MQRRAMLAGTVGVGLVGLTGCVGGDDEPSEPTDANDHYMTEEFQDQTVRFVPVETAYEWWQAGSAEFVDARVRTQYEAGHIDGAVFSPAPEGQEEDDPVAGWATDTPIVTYCVCPITQAGRRAATLMAAGYDHVYGLEEGLNPWIDAGYPTESNETAALTTYDVTGQADSRYAGERVRLREPTTGQRESAVIDADGTFDLELHFVDTAPETTVELETPTGRREGSIGAFAAEPIVL